MNELYSVGWIYFQTDKKTIKEWDLGDARQKWCPIKEVKSDEVN